MSNPTLGVYGVCVALQRIWHVIASWHGVQAMSFLYVERFRRLRLSQASWRCTFIWFEVELWTMCLLWIFYEPLPISKSRAILYSIQIGSSTLQIVLENIAIIIY